MEQFSGQDFQTMWNMGGLQSPTLSVSDAPCLYDGWQQQLLPTFVKDMPLSPADCLLTDTITYDDKLGETFSSLLSPSPGSEKSEESALVPQAEMTDTDSHTWMGTAAELRSMTPQILAMIRDHGPVIAANGGSQPYRVLTTTQENENDPTPQEVQKPTITLSTKERAMTTSTSPKQPRGTNRITSTPTTAPPTAPMAVLERKRKSRVSSHNETERKYRGRINQQFQLLAEALCLDKPQSSSEDEARGPSKADVLSAATQCIRSLQKDVETQAKHIDTLKNAIRGLQAATASSALTVGPWEVIL